MSKRLAIDIVVLPPDNVMNKAISLNSNHDPAFLLNKTDRLPHVTLMQAVFQKSDLKNAEARLARIAAQTPKLILNAKTASHPAGFLSAAETSDLVISNSPALQELHQKIMDGFEDIASYDAVSDEFYDQDTRQQSLKWVHNFLANAAYQKFWPHITLGIRRPVNEDIELDFTADRLAFCHLGDYNTCRKILFEFRLGES